MTTIEINGKKLAAEAGSMIIEVADNAGIYIPRYCYHKKLTIAANCRMCLIEVEKVGKPLPACATPITDGMKVYTRSAKALEAQRAVTEYLLINHPLDCPVCDQGGECELQDLSMGYGKDRSRFNEPKRAVADEDLGPLIESYMTRCIQCTRCVRFGQEIAGLRELGATERGEDMKIETYVKKSLKSELSGNIIDICPVGALTSKPFRFKARAWELIQKPSIAPHDCVGSNVYVHVLRNKVLRVVPHANEAINEVWLSDRDRFSYEGVYSEDRLIHPLIKRDNHWEEVSWEGAFAFAGERLQQIVANFGAEQLAAWISPTATLEECYLLQKILRGLGSENIDHRLHQTDFTDQAAAPIFPGLAMELQGIEALDRILLVGSNITREQPLASHRIRKATQIGAQVMAINPLDFAVNFPLQEKVIVHPYRLVLELAEVAKVLLDNHKANSLPANLQTLFSSITPSATAERLARTFSQGKRTAIFLGALAQNHPQAATLRTLVKLIAHFTGAEIGYFTVGPNSAGAWLAGAIPHRQVGGRSTERPGKNIHESLTAKLKAYILYNIDPELDCANPGLVNNTLNQAELVIACSPFKSSSLMQHCHVIFPIVPFTETSGTFVNVEGRWQSFSAAVPPLGDSRPGWKILRVLGNTLALEGFNYVTSEEICSELQNKCVAQKSSVATELSAIDLSQLTLKSIVPQGLTRIAQWPIYGVDNLVRRSKELQAAESNDAIGIYVNADTVKHLQLDEDKMVVIKQGDGQIKLPLVIDERVPDHCVLVDNGWVETSVLGESFGEIEVKSV